MPLPLTLRITADWWTFRFACGPDAPAPRPSPAYLLPQDHAGPARRFGDALLQALTTALDASGDGSVMLRHAPEDTSPLLRDALQVAGAAPDRLPFGRSCTTARGVDVAALEGTPDPGWWTLWPLALYVEDARGQRGVARCERAQAQVRGYPTVGLSECDAGLEPSVPCLCWDAAFEHPIEGPFCLAAPRSEDARVLPRLAQEVLRRIQGRGDGDVGVDVHAGAGKAVTLDAASRTQEPLVLHPAAHAAAEWWRGTLFRDVPPPSGAAEGLLDLAERRFAQELDAQLRAAPDAGVALGDVAHSPHFGHTRTCLESFRGAPGFLLPEGVLAFHEGRSRFEVRGAPTDRTLWTLHQSLTTDAARASARWWTRRLRLATARRWFPDAGLDNFRCLLLGALDALQREHPARFRQHGVQLRQVPGPEPVLAITLLGPAPAPSQHLEFHHACEVRIERLPAPDRARLAEALGDVTLSVCDRLVRWEETAEVLWMPLAVVRDRNGRTAALACTHARALAERWPRASLYTRCAPDARPLCVCQGFPPNLPFEGPYRHASPVAALRFLSAQGLF